MLVRMSWQWPAVTQTQTPSGQYLRTGVRRFTYLVMIWTSPTGNPGTTSPEMCGHVTITTKTT